MPKKPPKNGFFFFMLNYKRRAESQGKTFPGGLPEVAIAASPEWNSLPNFRRDYYNDLAKSKRNDPRPNIQKRDERRFNSQGKSFAEIKMEAAHAEERRKQERDFISNFVFEMNLNDLRDKLMYFIHVNIFCKTDKDIYFPAEIGIVKFSLRGGVKDVLHRYIDPGDITPGYSFEVKDHSERSHKLTPNFVRSVDGTSDFRRLYDEICKFLTEDEVKNEGTMPPLFTMYDNVLLNTSLSAVKGTFRSLWSHVRPADDPDDNNWENVFKILPLPEMFFHLKNRCLAVTNPQTIAFPNDVLAKAELQKDTYHYELDTACKFHRDEDIIAHCSRSFVLRWVYIIRDHCADLIGVDLFPEYIDPKVEIKEETDEYHDTWDVKGVKQDWDRHSPKNRVKWERDRYSPDRHAKRETDRYSSDRRVKRERDRSYSPDCQVKRERDRSRSPDHRIKRERDHPRSPDHRIKRERDWPRSPDHRIKRERDQSRSPDHRIKRERDQPRSPDHRIKRERDQPRSPDHRINRERDQPRSPDHRINRERDQSRSPDHRIKRERDQPRSPDHRIKRERDQPRSPDHRIKRERDQPRSPDHRIKRERDQPRSPDHRIKRERDQPCSPDRHVKEEKYCSPSPHGRVRNEANTEPSTSDSIKLEKEENVKMENEVDVLCTTDSVKVEVVDLTSDWW